VTSSNRAERFNTGADGATVARPSKAVALSPPIRRRFAEHRKAHYSPHRHRCRRAVPRFHLSARRRRARQGRRRLATRNNIRAEILHQAKLSYNNRAPDDQGWVFVAIERFLVSIYLRLRILL